MPATNARISFITSQYRLSTVLAAPALVELYGNLARDTTDPVETFFTNQADARVMAEERLLLLQQQRYFVTVQTASEGDAQGLRPTDTVPTVRVIDDEQDRNGRALAVGLTIDMRRDRSEIQTWG